LSIQGLGLILRAPPPGGTCGIPSIAIVISALGSDRVLVNSCLHPGTSMDALGRRECKLTGRVFTF